MIRLLTGDDRDIVMDYISRNPMETTFYYSNVLEFGLDNRAEIRRCGDYFGYFEEYTLKGIAVFYNLGSCIPHFESEGAVMPFVELMKDRKFHALMGVKRIIKPIYDGLSEFKPFARYNESIYMVNNNFRPHIADGISFKDADWRCEDDVRFTADAFTNYLENPRTIEAQRDMLKQRDTEGDHIIAVKDGKYVAQACIQTYTDKVNQIGGVATVPDERGKGYAKAAVSELCRRITDRGKTPTLIVSRDNTPAVRVYTALGFEYLDDYLFIKY